MVYTLHPSESREYDQMMALFIVGKEVILTHVRVLPVVQQNIASTKRTQSVLFSAQQVMSNFDLSTEQ